MRVVNPIGRIISTEEEANYMVQPQAGCVCSSGQANASFPRYPFTCSCQCDGNSTNYNANYNKADQTPGI